MNLPVLFGVALVPLLVGMVWYNPKVLGNAWMQACGFSEEQMKNADKSGMWKIFIQVYIFSLFFTFILQFLVIHQFGAFGMIGGNIENALPSFQAFMTDYGSAFRTFKHGALHGSMSGLFIGLFMVGTSALFEMKSWKYILIHVGYYMLCATIMGGLLCQFMTFN